MTSRLFRFFVSAWTDSTVLEISRAATSKVCYDVGAHRSPVFWYPNATPPPDIQIHPTVSFFLPSLLFHRHFCSISHCGCLSVRLRLFSLARLHFYLAPRFFDSVCASSLFFFIVIFRFVCAPRCFFLPAYRVSSVTLRFGYLFYAAVRHKLRMVASRTIASSYPWLSKSRIHAFQTDWTVQ